MSFVVRVMTLQCWGYRPAKRGVPGLWSDGCGAAPFARERAISGHCLRPITPTLIAVDNGKTRSGSNLSHPAALLAHGLASPFSHGPVAPTRRSAYSPDAITAFFLLKEFAPMPESCVKKIIVAIHGIGQQQRCDTVRRVAHSFACWQEVPLPLLPLGFFNTSSNLAYVEELLVPIPVDKTEPPHPLAKVGFAEIYWADIPRGVVTQGDTLEESKGWAQTIVARANRLAVRGSGSAHMSNTGLAGSVIAEAIEGIGVMENLTWVLGKLGIFKFDLAQVLADYVGDVQLVADFKPHRDAILVRLHEAMTDVLKLHQAKYPGTEVELHLVSHSEGSVISFLALLQALDQPSEDASDPRHEWVTHVRSFMTIGSPIDKHLLLWPAIWPRQQEPSAGQPCPGGVPPVAPAQRWRPIERPIEWLNYYDVGDPIGFELDSARDYLKAHGCEAFSFDESHDIGFSRYLVPGKAHISYWTDRDVFRHFAYKAGLSTVPAEAPASHWWCKPLSTPLPYGVAFLLHLAAVYLMCTAVLGFLGAHWGLAKTSSAVIALTFLLAGVTVAGRLPRLVKRSDTRWMLLAAAVFALGASLCLYLLPSAAAEYLTGVFTRMVPSSWGWAPDAATLLVVVGAVLVAASWNADRLPRRGRQVMVGGGAAVLGIAMVMGVITRTSAPGTGAPLWPLLLSAAAFMYLWWLGIVLFDLTFIWQWYIRNTAALSVLRKWARHSAQATGQAQGKPAPMPHAGPTRPTN